jgi:hypothetical protein
MHHRLIKLPIVLPQFVVLGTTRISLVHMWLDDYVSPDNNDTGYAPRRLRFMIKPGSSTMGSSPVTESP